MKLPDYRALGAPPPVQGSQRIPSYSTDGFVADVGKGIRDFGAGISTVGEKLQKKIDEDKNEADTLQRAQADADFRIGSMKSLDEAANDQDYEGAPEKFRKSASEHLETAAGNIADPQAKELFRIKGRTQIEQDAFRLERITQGRRRDEVIQNNDTRLDELGRRAVIAPDEQSQAAIIQEGNQLIEGSVRAGYLSPSQAAAKRKAFTENFATQVYADKIERDPRGVLEDFKKLEGAQQGRPVAGPGMIEAGNIDMSARPVVQNADGSVSTVKSMSVGIDGRQVLIPTISDDGRTLTPDQAIQQYKDTGKHLGIFDTPENATAFAKQLSSAQGNIVGAEAPAARDYGSLTLPFSVPSFAKATVLDKLEKSGVVEQLPKPLQEKIKAGAEGDAPLTLTKQDLDSIPAGPWKTIAKELKPLGVPEPKDAPAAKAAAASSPIQIAKQFEGLHETRDRGVIADFIEKSAGKKIDPAQTAWCAAFVNAVLGESGRGGTGSLMARSFLRYGKETNEPTEGDIVVLTRGDPNGPYGHVGFYAGRDENGNVKVLAGNQGNAVSTRSFPESQVLGFRKPPEAGTPIAGIETAPAPAKSGTLLDFIPPDKLMVIRRKAEGKAWEMGATERATVERGIDDDLMSVRQTGDGPRVDPNVIARAFGNKGPEKAVEYQETRRLNRDVWANTSDFSRMTSDQIGERLATLEPKPGPGMAYQAKVRDEVQKEADQVLEMRREDPAKAVLSLPTVAQAVKNAKDPVSRKAAADASMAAQADIGIPEDLQTPATKAEATELGRPLRNMLPGTEQAALREVAQTIQERYPDHAERVFEQVLRANKFNNDVGKKAAGVLRKLSNGELPTRAEEEAADQEREVNAANRAVTATPAPTGKPVFDDPNYAKDLERALVTGPSGMGLGGGAKDEAFANVPARAVQMLRSNPALADQFDAKYGKGTAKKVLELGVKK